jgi:hypothetical protein
MRDQSSRTEGYPTARRARFYQRKRQNLTWQIASFGWRIGLIILRVPQSVGQFNSLALETMLTQFVS